MPDPSDFSFTRVFLKGEAAHGFWSVATKFLGFANALFILSALTLYEYGAFQLLMASYAFMTLAMSLPSGGSVAVNDILRFTGAKKEAEAKRLFAEHSLVGVSAGIGLFAVVFFGAPLLSFRFGSEFIAVIRLTSFLFLHEAFWAVAKPLLQARLQFSRLASRPALTKLVQLGLLAAFVRLGGLGVWEVMLSQIAASFLTALSVIPSLVRSYRPWRGLAMSRQYQLPRIFRTYGKWSFLETGAAQAAGFLQPWLTKILISTEAVAIFSMAERIIQSFKDFLPAKTLSTLIPLVLEDRAKSQRVFSYGAKYLVILSVALAGAAFFVVPPIVGYFFVQYRDALPIFTLLLVTLPLTALGVMPTLFLAALRERKALFYLRLVKVSVEVTLLVILLPVFGLWGLALKDILLQIVNVSTHLWRVKKTILGARLKGRDFFSFEQADAAFLKTFWQSGWAFIRRRAG